MRPVVIALLSFALVPPLCAQERVKPASAQGGQAFGEAW